MSISHYFTSLHPSSRLSWLSVLALCVVVAFVLRFPFLFISNEPWTTHALVYHDEGILLLDGGEVLDGYLPYVRHWDNRPPLDWYIFAAISAVAGAHLSVVRLMGTLLVGLTAFVIYRAGTRADSRTTGLWAAGYYLVFSSCVQASQSMNSDHIFAFLFAALLYCIFKPNLTRRTSVIVGGLFAACCLTLTNNLVLLPAIVFPFFLPVFAQRNSQQVREALRAAVVITAIVFAGFFAFWGLYALHGQGDLLLESIFLAPLSVQRAEHFDVLGNITHRFRMLWQFLSFYLGGPFWLLPALVCGFFVLYWKAVSSPQEKKPCDNVLLVMLLFLIVALLVRGSFYPYQMLQLLPVVALIMARATVELLQKLGKGMLAVIVVGLISASAHVLFYYVPLAEYAAGERVAEHPFYNDMDYQLADIINAHATGGPDRSLYMCEDETLLHVLTRTRFIPYVILLLQQVGNPHIYEILHHPMHLPEQLYAQIMQAKPTFIVARRNNPCLARMAAVSNQYVTIGSVENVFVYARKEPEAYSDWNAPSNPTSGAVSNPH